MTKPLAFNYADYVRLLEKYKSLRNFACQLCGKYQYAHEGACGDCRWKAKEGDNAE